MGVVFGKGFVKRIEKYDLGIKEQRQLFNHQVIQSLIKCKNTQDQKMTFDRDVLKTFQTLKPRITPKDIKLIRISLNNNQYYIKQNSLLENVLKNLIEKLKVIQ